jgi:hypothetical protein
VNDEALLVSINLTDSITNIDVSSALVQSKFATFSGKIYVIAVLTEIGLTDGEFPYYNIITPDNYETPEYNYHDLNGDLQSETGTVESDTVVFAMSSLVKQADVSASEDREVPTETPQGPTNPTLSLNYNSSESKVEVFLDTSNLSVTSGDGIGLINISLQNLLKTDALDLTEGEIKELITIHVDNFKKVDGFLPRDTVNVSNSGDVSTITLNQPEQDLPVMFRSAIVDFYPAVTSGSVLLLSFDASSLKQGSIISFDETQSTATKFSSDITESNYISSTYWQNLTFGEPITIPYLTQDGPFKINFNTEATEAEFVVNLRWFDKSTLSGKIAAFQFDFSNIDITEIVSTDPEIIMDYNKTLGSNSIAFIITVNEFEHNDSLIFFTLKYNDANTVENDVRVTNYIMSDISGNLYKLRSARLLDKGSGNLQLQITPAAFSSTGTNNVISAIQVDFNPETNLTALGTTNIDDWTSKIFGPSSLAFATTNSVFEYNTLEVLKIDIGSSTPIQNIDITSFIIADVNGNEYILKPDVVKI